jgi:hypothetical protein
MSTTEMTTTTFADYVAQQDARNTIQLNVRKWTLMLCDALVDNFKQRNHGSINGIPAPEYKFYIEKVVSITNLSWRLIMVLDLFMLS